MEEAGPQTRNRNEKCWSGGWLVHSQDRLGYAAITSILKISAAYQNVILFPAHASFPCGCSAFQATFISGGISRFSMAREEHSRSQTR